MKVAVFLPVKGNSERVQSKNTALLDGKPLFLHTLEKLCAADFFDEIWLDTESDDVISLASHLDVSILKRDARLASNKTDGNQLFLNELNYTDADIVIQILATSPFISLETIHKAISIVKTGEKGDSVVLVNKQKQYTWSNGKADYDIRNIPNSKDLPDTVIETMGLYVIKKDTALTLKRRVGNSPYLLQATPLESIDVNWPDDFYLASLIASGLREKDRKLLDNMKIHLSSPLLSDVIDDLGVAENTVLLGLQPNLKGAKIFGRAKTLKIRAIKDGEDYTGIYDALNSYSTIVPNDVIVVENEAGEYAYFGELNANLAVRCGASGAIIGGKTRDNEQVKALGFTTFSTGYVAKDVRKRAVTESINKCISLYGTPVAPGDLIFADSEGVVVIGKKDEKKILDEVFKRLKTEQNILLDIATGVDVSHLTKLHGDF